MFWLILNGFRVICLEAVLSEVLQSDRKLAQGIVAMDLDGIGAAIASGAKAHMTPMAGVSWAFLPLALGMNKPGGLGEAMSDKARACVRALIDGGAPVKGLAHLVGAGVQFEREDFNYFLDNWLWRDANEIRLVAKRVLGNDEVMAMLAETGHIDPMEVAYDDVSIFEHVCKHDMYRSVAALGLAGADINAWVGSGDDRMSAIESAASMGHVMTVNALITSGAYYDEHKLIERMRPHGEAKVTLMRECVLGFEHDQPVIPADLAVKVKSLSGESLAI